MLDPSARDSRNLTPSDVVVWTCTCVFVVTAVFTSLHFFAGWPPIAKEYEGRLFNALIAQVVAIGVAAFARGLNVPLPKWGTPSSTQKKAEKGLPPIEKDVQASIAVPPQNLPEQREKRKKRGLVASSIAIVLSLASALAAFRHVVDSPEVNSQARIIGHASLAIPATCAVAKISLYEIAEGAKLELVAQREASNSAPPTSYKGSNGSNGQGFGAPGGNGDAGGTGAAGTTGLSGLNVEVVVKQLNGSLSVLSSGEKGGPGSKGGAGGEGGVGAQGTPAQNNGPGDPGHCNAWNGIGGRGGNGGTGGIGGGGGSGGTGGKVTISVGALGPHFSLTVSSPGGPGGEGGLGGLGGQGGAGGPPGSLAPPGCSQNAPGRVVTDGKLGVPGANGQAGPAGGDGVIILETPAGDRKVTRGDLKLP
jgi:hypothetical protein